MPQTGDVWKHPNARVAYVAQHAFHHIESHLHQTANEYIRWRYSNGEDKESLVKVSMVLTEEEQKLQKEAFEVLWKVLTHLLTHSLTYSLIHSLTHSLTGWWRQATKSQQDCGWVDGFTSWK